MRKPLLYGLDVDDVVGQVFIVVQSKLFSEPVSFYLHASGGDVDESCYLFGREIKPQVSAQLQIIGRKVGVDFCQVFKEVSSALLNASWKSSQFLRWFRF